MSDSEVDKIISDMEEVMRFRLRLREIIPVEMARYRIGQPRQRIQFTSYLR